MQDVIDGILLVLPIAGAGFLMAVSWCDLDAADLMDGGARWAFPLSLALTLALLVVVSRV